MSFTAFSLHSLDESDNTTPNLSPQFNEFKEENKEEKMFINIPSLISSNSNPICFQTIKEVDAFNEVSPKFVYDKGRNDVRNKIFFILIFFNLNVGVTGRHYIYIIL